MYKTAELPAKWANAPAAWAVHHPPPEYQYMLWTDESLRELIATDYPWLLPTYDAYPYPTQRWDASRYAVLHKYGGLYVDLDLHPIASVGPLLRGQTLLLPYTPNIGLTNAVMAATAGHPFLEFVLRGLPQFAHRWYHVGKHNAVLSSTGSTFIWARYMSWIRDHPDPLSAGGLLPSADWGKCSYCDRQHSTLAKPPSSVGAPDGFSSSAADLSAIGAGRWLAATVAPPLGVMTGDGATARQVEVAMGSARSAAALGEGEGGAESSAGHQQVPEDTGWRSPFEHLQGSSWHSLDSAIQLRLFCHTHELVLLAVLALVWLCLRDCRLTAVVALALLVGMAVQHCLGILLSEALIGRPWIWLIMS